MAYLAMARKWRPKNFEDMVGQDHIAQTIRNAIEGKRISHAYLFTGTRGVGKTTSARILAKALNCKNGPTPIPCDKCENCKSVNNGSSMDVLEIDGASNNSVDNIRELREQVNYAPMNGTYKIYVIDEVHMLSKSAFNALLKTLEEPPPHVVFIFATTEANKLPHTILSRVQRFDFKRISEQNIRERLEYICAQEGIKPEREALEAIARKADGSMRDALSLFDQVYAFSGADLSLEAARKVLGLPRDGMFDGLLRALIQHDQKVCFTTLQEANREGIETSELLAGFGEYLRNMLFARQGVNPGALGLGEARYAELVSLAPELRDGDIIRFAKMISDILAQIKNAANPRLAVELGFARMAALDRVVTLSQVLGQDFAPAISAPATSVAAPRVADRPSEPDAPGGSDLAEVKKKSPFDTLNHPASPATAGSRDGVGGDFAFRPAATAVLAPAFAPVTAPASAKAEGEDPLGSGSDSLYALPDLVPAGSAVPGGVRIPEPETETEIDTEPEMDPEDPGFGNPAGENFAPMRPHAPAVDPESLTVPVQAGSSALPGLWPALVEEFMAMRPLLGSHLRRTRLEHEAGETNTLRVTFLERSAYSLLGDDADFRKSFQAFLASKVAGGRDCALRFALDENAAESDAAPMALSFGGADPAGKEPIIKFILDLFEGRQVG
ncbi:MAG: DNA polymerase III subunit gamma/tau [Fibrobacteria bacterium]